MEEQLLFLKPEWAPTFKIQAGKKVKMQRYFEMACGPAGPSAAVDALEQETGTAFQCVICWLPHEYGENEAYERHAQLPPAMARFLPGGATAGVCTKCRNSLGQYKCTFDWKGNPQSSVTTPQQAKVCRQANELNDEKQPRKRSADDEEVPAKKARHDRQAAAVGSDAHEQPLEGVSSEVRHWVRTYQKLNKKAAVMRRRYSLLERRYEPDFPQWLSKSAASNSETSKETRTILIDACNVVYAGGERVWERLYKAYAALRNVASSGCTRPRILIFLYVRWLFELEPSWLVELMRSESLVLVPTKKDVNQGAKMLRQDP